MPDGGVRTAEEDGLVPGIAPPGDRGSAFAAVVAVDHEALTVARLHEFLLLSVPHASMIKVYTLAPLGPKVPPK